MSLGRCYWFLLPCNFLSKFSILWRFSVDRMYVSMNLFIVDIWLYIIISVNLWFSMLLVVMFVFHLQFCLSIPLFFSQAYDLSFFFFILSKNSSLFSWFHFQFLVLFISILILSFGGSGIQTHGLAHADLLSSTHSGLHYFLLRILELVCWYFYTYLEHKVSLCGG